MLTRRRDKARRIVMWVAGVVLAVSVAAWVVSLWCVYLGVGGVGVALYRGFVFVAVDRHAWAHVSADGCFGPPWWWLHANYFEYMRSYYQVDWDAYLPLWMPAAASTGVLLAIRFLSRQSREGSGHCLTCGYDLHGLPPNTSCPECGHKP